MSLFFPSALNQYSDRPVIVFSCFEGDDSGQIMLPAPVGMQMGDSANYSGVELGTLGGVALSATNSIRKAAGSMSNAEGAGKKMEALESSVGSSIDALKNQLTGANIGNAALAQLSGVGGKLGQAVGIGAGVSKNPNTTTEFTGVNVRKFNFTYKLVPSNKGESAMIKNIVQLFRINIYPEGNILFLKYPPKWGIKMLTASGGLPGNGAFPKFGECYLTEFSSTYNSSANAFFDDGAPVEVDISFGFTETKAYTKKEIKELL